MAGDKMNSKEFITQWQALPNNIRENNVPFRMVYLKSKAVIFCTEYTLTVDSLFDNSLDTIAKLYDNKRLIAMVSLKDIKRIAIPKSAI